MIRALLLSLIAGCAVLADDAAPEPFSDCRADDGDPIDVVALDGADAPVRVDGDTLYVQVGHGGGCEAHEYQICWPDGAFMESDPVQVRLDLWHDANGDGCEAYLTEELAFDLTPLKEAWQDAYQADAGAIVIHLGGESVTYTFAP